MDLIEIESAFHYESRTLISISKKHLGIGMWVKTQVLDVNVPGFRHLSLPVTCYVAIEGLSYFYDTPLVNLQ